MNPDYLDEWPESYPITLDAVREHLYGRPRIGDPAAWRRCAEYFAGIGSEANHGICLWLNTKAFPDELAYSDYADLAQFFRIISNHQRAWIWPTWPEFAPRRAALCRTVADRLEELQHEAKTRVVDVTPDASTMVELLRHIGDTRTHSDESIR